MITKRHTLSSQRLPGPLSEFAARNGVDVSKVVVEFRNPGVNKEKSMPSMDSVYKSFYGFGYLIFDDDDLPRLMTGYKLVIDIDDFSGGGFLLGLNEEDLIKRRNSEVCVSVSAPSANIFH